MKKTQKAISLLLSVLMAGSLGACGTGSQGSTSGSGTSEAKQEITISHYYIEEQRNQDADGDSFYAMLEKYQKAHPNVKITQTAMDQSDYATKIQAQAAVGEMPDVFLVKGSWFNNFVSNKLIAPLNEILDSYDKKDTYRDGIFDAATVDGKIYGLSTQFSVTSLVFYNAKMWKDIGYDKFPDNWNDIYAAIQKFNAKGITPIALGNKDKWPAESCILSALGDRYTGTDWTKSIIKKDGTAKFTDTSFVNALDQLQKLSKAKAFNADFNSIQNNPADEYYCSGKAATTIEGFWEIAYLTENATPDVLKNTKIAILPPVDGGKGSADSTSGGCGWFMGMSNALTGEKKKLVQDFLLSMYGYDYSEYVATEHGLPAPCNVKLDDVSKFPQLTQDYLKLMETTKLTPIYDIQMEGSVIETMNSGIQQLMNGSKDAKTVAAAIQTEQDKVAKKK